MQVTLDSADGPAQFKLLANYAASRPGGRSYWRRIRVTGIQSLCLPTECSRSINVPDSVFPYRAACVICSLLPWWEPISCTPQKI